MYKSHYNTQFAGSEIGDRMAIGLNIELILLTGGDFPLDMAVSDGIKDTGKKGAGEKDMERRYGK